MTALTIQMPKALGEGLERLAHRRGEPVDNLVREAVARFLEDIEDAELVADFESRRAAGTVELRDWEEFEEELDRDSG